MLSTRIILPITAFLGAIALAVTFAILPFIPSWNTFQEITAFMAMLGSVASAIWLARGVWKQTSERMQQAPRIILTVASSCVMAGMLFFAAIVCVFSLSGGLFEARFTQQFDYPEYNTTIYVYDNSFLDPEAKFTYQDGWLPFEKEIGSFGGMSAGDPGLSQEGEWVVCSLFRLHLPTGTVERDGGTYRD